MKYYTAQQQKYLDSVDGKAHMSAVNIIGLLEKTIKEYQVMCDKLIDKLTEMRRKI